ncbi:MAG: CAP family protein, partial [Sphaerospermopsis kisseleviana]
MNKLFSTLTIITGTALTLTLTGIVPRPFASIMSLSNQPAIAQTTIDLNTFRNTSLSRHNGYRATHRSPALTTSSSANTTAQSWAQYLATNGLFQHSSSTQRNNAGENLYVFYTTGSIDAATLANNAVKTWYDEVSKYNYSKPGFSAATGHFTQIVWKSSTQLGCGAARG